jgi:hypothetical protein
MTAARRPRMASSHALLNACAAKYLRRPFVYQERRRDRAAAAALPFAPALPVARVSPAFLACPSLTDVADDSRPRALFPAVPRRLPGRPAARLILALLRESRASLALALAACVLNGVASVLLVATLNRALAQPGAAMRRSRGASRCAR